MKRLLPAILFGAVVGWATAPGVIKGQTVRLLDVFIVGPVVIWAAKRGPKNDAMLLLLAAIGAATITYNGRNFLEIRDLQSGGDGVINLPF